MRGRAIPGVVLRANRRHWWALPIGVLVGVLVAIATAPSSRPSTPATYRAAVLVKASPASEAGVPGASSVDRLALFTIRGSVPQAAMKKLRVRFETSAWNRRRAISQRGRGGILELVGDSGKIEVVALPGADAGSLAIIATGERRAATAAANTFARQLIDDLDKASRQMFEAKVAALASDRRMARSEGGPVDVFDREFDRVSAVGPQASDLQLLESASAAGSELIVPGTEHSPRAWPASSWEARPGSQTGSRHAELSR